MENILSLTISIILIINTSVIIWCLIYNIRKDYISKERMFQIQLTSAESSSIKDIPPVVELYKIIDDTIKFYIARQVIPSNLLQCSEQELSIMLNDIILTIASNVEMHLSDRFKKMWEVYFDPIPKTKEDPPSHLNLYIYDNTKLILIRTIESAKMQNNPRKRPTQKTDSHE